MAHDVATDNRNKLTHVQEGVGRENALRLMPMMNNN